MFSPKIYGQKSILIDVSIEKAFEIYESDPITTPENDLVTVLHFPLK
ncbi:MAG: hypothetical protein HOH33_09645 [Verrucomicrobia bacterium]|jgi:hypothetical protein|nr:hypothetical protein [Verrucomicrobiota bacterium]